MVERARELWSVRKGGWRLGCWGKAGDGGGEALEMEGRGVMESWSGR